MGSRDDKARFDAAGQANWPNPKPEAPLQPTTLHGHVCDCQLPQFCSRPCAYRRREEAMDWWADQGIQTERPDDRARRAEGETYRHVSPDDDGKPTRWPWNTMHPRREIATATLAALVVLALIVWGIWG